MERSDQEIKQIRTAQTVVSTAIHRTRKRCSPGFSGSAHSCR
jgi:hypothetical protein